MNRGGGWKTKEGPVVVLHELIWVRKLQEARDRVP